MGYQRQRWELGIWGLGLGYFISYTPYSGLTKAASSGQWPGLTGPVSGLEMLPASALATLVGMFGFLSVMGWWKYAGRRSCYGVQIPFPGWGTFLSGLCMATIIGTTTLAFTFRGVSIVFMLVLFRGGILILAPLVDLLCRRHVRWFSWAALTLSLAALVVTLADVNGYQMSLVAGLDVIAYLISYFLRLRTMTRQAKSGVPNAALRYFVEEQMVASPALVLALGLLALVGGEALVPVRRGFTTFLDSPALDAALLVGLSYAILCIFTTFIFLDQRENTFCIPMHCCSSMLSGVVASYALAKLCGLAPPTVAQLVGSGILILAILCLCFPALEALSGVKIPDARAGLQQLYLFVCSGNTSRSPMAQAFCNDAIARRLGLRLDQLDDAPFRAISAGLTAQPGRPFAGAAASALERRGVAPHAHASQEVTPELVRQADFVFCMTEEQRRTLAARVPDAAAKIQCLDPDGDIEDPSGGDAAFFDRVSERLQQAVQRRLQLLTI